MITKPTKPTKNMAKTKANEKYKPRFVDCPECNENTLEVIYDNEDNGGWDSYVCHNENCRWRG